MIGALLMVTLAATAMAAGPLVLQKFDFVHSDQSVIEVPTNYAHINYLHGSEWNYEGDTKAFTKCPGHVDHVVEHENDLLKMAQAINDKRFIGSDAAKTRFTTGRQSNVCRPPRCVGSVNDLLVCGGIALAVEGWATVTGIDPIMNTRDGPRGPTCVTGKVRLWTDSMEPYYIFPKIDGRTSFVFELLDIVNFARDPLLCGMPSTSADPADRFVSYISDYTADVAACQMTTPAP